MRSPFFNVLTAVVVIVLIIVVISSCAPVVKKEDVFIAAGEIKAAASVTEPVPAPMATPVAAAIPEKKVFPLAVEETLIYKAKYWGIPIGTFVVVNKGLTELNGRAAYHFELTVKTLPFFGDIKDLYVSYMDAERLVVLRHEEYIKGHVLESAVDFDYALNMALYHNAVTGQKKQVPIPHEIHDIVTGGYFLRTAPLGLGDTIELNVYADEKIYNYLGYLHSRILTPAGSTEKGSDLLRSYVFHEGKQVQGISADVIFTPEAYRKPLRAVLKTFLGNVSVTLE